MKLIECPRDAMQGINQFIPTEQKIDYINMLLKVGFHTIDFGSFVSPKAIPQMKDTEDVLKGLEINDTSTKLLSIIANIKGLNQAIQFNEIEYIGFPFSISEIFQKRNTNKNIDQSLSMLYEIQNKCINADKKLVVYLSMAFGNPYNEFWSEDIVAFWSEKIVNMEIKIISLADTVGVSNKKNITNLFNLLIYDFPNVEWGAHLHSDISTCFEKIEAAYNSGCRRFDGSINGIGGCPMASNNLIGNIPTEKLLSFLNKKNISSNINPYIFESSFNKAKDIFN